MFITYSFTSTLYVFGWKCWEFIYRHLFNYCNIAMNKLKYMGLTKSEIFTDQQNKIATLAKAFGHPARVAILQHLFKIDSCICGDLVNEIGLAQPTISQHLKELKNLGLIKGSIEGTSVCYCIDQKVWEEMSYLLTNFLTQKFKAAEGCC